MSHRVTEQDIGNVSPLDCCDMELRFTLIAVEAINNEFETFTPEQGKDLRRLREMVDEMLMRCNNDGDQEPLATAGQCTVKS